MATWKEVEESWPRKERGQGEIRHVRPKARTRRKKRRDKLADYHQDTPVIYTTFHTCRRHIRFTASQVINRATKTESVIIIQSNLKMQSDI